MRCDVCGAPGAVIIGNLTTGEQLVYCEEHRAQSGIGAPAYTPPALCEMCEAEPPVALQEALADHSRLAMCSRCLILSGRISYLSAPPELRELVDAMAEPQAAEGGNGSRRRRRTRGGEASLAVVDGDQEEGDETAAASTPEHPAGNGGHPLEAELRRQEETDPRDALEPHSVLDHPDAGSEA